MSDNVKGLGSVGTWYLLAPFMSVPSCLVAVGREKAQGSSHSSDVETSTDPCSQDQFPPLSRDFEETVGDARCRRAGSTKGMPGSVLTMEESLAG